MHFRHVANYKIMTKEIIMKRRKIVDIINNINYFDDFFKKCENLID